MAQVSHKDLTGAELHESKGVSTASLDTVYVANGSGSGVWTDKYSGYLIRNRFWMEQTITDVSTPNSNCWFHVPVQSEIVELSVITSAALTTANGILSVYINGVLFADSLTIIQAGSVAGTLHRVTMSTANTVAANSVIEIRSNGATDTASLGYVTLGMRAK